MTVTATAHQQARDQPVLADHLAFLALVLAAFAAAAGLAIPDLYRDTAEMVREAHAADFVTLTLALPVLALGLARARAGSTSARMVILGAVGYLAYSYAIYGFSVVINLLTPLHLAILGLTVWSFLLALGNVEPDAGAAMSRTRPPRRTTAGFLLVIAALFAVLWLSQIAGAITSGELPASISDLDLPTNAVYALDLSFALPLLTLVAIWLIRRDRRGANAAVAALTFTVLMGSSVLAIFVVDASAGVPVEAIPIGIFAAVTGMAILLLVRGRQTRSRPAVPATGPPARSPATSARPSSPGN